MKNAQNSRPFSANQGKSDPVRNWGNLAWQMPNHWATPQFDGHSILLYVNRSKHFRDNPKTTWLFWGRYRFACNLQTILHVLTPSLPTVPIPESPRIRTCGSHMGDRPHSRVTGSILYSLLPQPHATLFQFPPQP